MVFGWSGGSALVKTSYVDAKEKASEMKEERHEEEGAEKRQEGEPRDAQRAPAVVPSLVGDEDGEPPG